MTPSFEEMKKLLKHFPSSTDEKQTVTIFGNRCGPFQKARACTLAFSGKFGYNCRIKPWEENNLQIGVVVDHRKVDIPYGDMIAYKSYDMILDGSYVTKKSNKKGKVTKDKVNIPYGNMTASGSNDLILDDPDVIKKCDIKGKITKYDGKEVVYQLCSPDGSGITNQAKLIKLPNGFFINLKEGSIRVFATNVWRKYFKYKKNTTNEALCLQKENGENPIVGIFLNIRLGLSGGIIEPRYPDISREEDRENLLNILKENSQLKLYIYDVRQEEHIVRVVENEEARDLISSRCDFRKDFVATLTRYQGFQDQQLATPQSVISVTESQNIKNPNFLENNEKNPC